ncbi:hypothetical protein [Microbacterium paludicola]|uniref:hypothetical protein n=1 Tax=Microbacterium paludicola TaxID=300019 RepID=UPI0011A32196|nr:hypothetical protein [Microbacterium paludicola]
MSNPLVPPLPLPDDDRAPEEHGADVTDPLTVERDGQRDVDPDMDPDLIESATADQVASGADDD